MNICLEILRSDIWCSLENDFIEFIWVKLYMLFHLNVNKFNSYHSFIGNH